jgi:hypothetical protein
METKISEIREFSESSPACINLVASNNTNYWYISSNIYYRHRSKGNRITRAKQYQVKILNSFFAFPFQENVKEYIRQDPV